MNKAKTDLANPARLAQIPDGPHVAMDHNCRTAIVLERKGKTVRAVVMESSGLRVSRHDVKEFDAQFKPTDYPVKRASTKYLETAKLVGITERAAKELRHLSAARIAAGAARPPDGQDLVDDQDGDEDVSNKKAATKKATKAKAPTAKKEGKGIGEIVRDGLKAGKQTEEILAEVKKHHPKAATSAKTVAWYRSQMKADGDLPKGK